MLVAAHGEWRFHAGADTPQDRRRLLRFMWRRGWWTARRHGWHDTVGKSAATSLVIGLCFACAAAWPPRPFTVLVFGLGLPLAFLTLYPLIRLLALLVSWRRLNGKADGWITHWCEGPNDALAVRMTHPSSGSTPPRWPGTDLYGQHDGGEQLIRWLAEQAQHNGAILVIRTGQPWLEKNFYQLRTGLTLVEQPWLRTRHVQLGTSMLCSRSPVGLPVRPWWRRPLSRAVR